MYNTENLTQYLSLVIEEYKSLRQESIQSNINMFTTLRWGIAIIGVLFVAGFANWNQEHAVVLLVFYILIPAFSTMTMLYWIGEIIRFKRVGDYICFIEQKTGMIFDELKKIDTNNDKWKKLQIELEERLSIKNSNINLSDSLAWSRWIRERRSKKRTETYLSLLIYYIRGGFFQILSLFSILIATYYTLTFFKSTPPYLGYIKNFIPSSEIKLFFLIIVSLIIFFLSSIALYIVFRSLKVKIKGSIIRNSYPKEYKTDLQIEVLKNCTI